MSTNSSHPKVHTRWLDLLLSIWRCSGQELNGQVWPIFLNGQMGNRTVFLLTQSCTVELPNQTFTLTCWPSKNATQTGKKCFMKLSCQFVPICATRKPVLKSTKKSFVFIQLSLWKVDILQQACINDGVQVTLHCTPQHCLTMSIEHIWIRSSAKKQRSALWKTKTMNICTGKWNIG